jgi:hypothetical protein
MRKYALMDSDYNVLDILFVESFYDITGDTFGKYPIISNVTGRDEVIEIGNVYNPLTDKFE